MYFRGTKDHYDVETEETERLVRPAPKVKPPRTDLRREEVQNDRDPDIDGDPDFAEIPKRAMSLRVALRVRADILNDEDSNDDLIKVRHKETGVVTYVTPETYEKNHYKYEEVRPGDEDENDADEEKDYSDSEEDRIDHLRTLKKQLTANPDMRAAFREFMTSPHYKDDTPLNDLIPKGNFIHNWYKTVGDLRQAVRDLKHISEPSKKKAPEAPADKGAEPPKDTEAPKDEKPKDETEKAPSPKEKTAPEKKTTLHDEDRKVLDDWLSIEGPKDKDFRSWAAGQAGVREKDGQVFFEDKERQKLVSFESLPEKKQWEVKRRFDHDQRASKTVDALKSSLESDPNMQDLLHSLSDPNSDLSKKLNGSLDRDPRKIPELKGYDFPEGVDFLRELVTAARQIYKTPPAQKERRKFSEQERIRALSQIVSQFPPDVAKGLMDQKLHPDDVTELVSTYHVAREAKPKNTQDALDMVKGSYATSPADVLKPPRYGRSKVTGEEVPFEELSAEEQADAMQKHRIRTVAISLAAREAVVERLAKKTDASEEAIGPVADFLLRKPANETPEQRGVRAQRAAKNAFYKAIQTGAWDSTDNSRWGGDSDGEERSNKSEPSVEDDDFKAPKLKMNELTDGQVRRLLNELKDDPPSQQLIVGYLQGADYNLAKKKFLSPSFMSDTKLSEYQSVGKIQSGLKQVSSFFDTQAKRYPPEFRWVNNPSADFRQKILDRIQTLAPEKFPEIDQWNQDFEDSEYERRMAEWQKLFQANSPYRAQGFKAPPQPVEPIGYASRRGDKKENRTRGKDLVSDHLRQIEEPESGEISPQKVVDRAQRKYSSYSKHLAMTDRTKEAVYWGVAPYAETKEAYPKGHLDSRGDLPDSEFDGLLKAAREWMRAPVLSDNVEGIGRDVQARAAIDLSLRSYKEGQFSAGLNPAKYEELVTKLMGKTAADRVVSAATKKACGDCACGNHDPATHDSSVNTASGETPVTKELGKSMKASVELRALATRVASSQPTLAYDILALSDKLAEQEQQAEQAPAQEQKAAGLPPEFLENQKKKEDESKSDEGQGEQKQASYQELRSHVIRLAHANPHLREAYKPLLVTIKQLG